MSDPHLPPGIEDAYPLTALQAGMIFHNVLDHSRSTYRDVCSALLRAPFSREAFRRALDIAAARHDVLRTAFDLVGFDEPVQLVFGRVELPLEVEDLRGLTPDERARRVPPATDVSIWPTVRWDKPPLLRVKAQLVADDLFWATLVFHHAILDGWSVAVLLSELFQSYAAELGRAPRLETTPPRSRFRDYVAEERRILSSSSSRRYWEAVLSRRWVSSLSGSAGALHPTTTLATEAVEVSRSELTSLVAAAARLKLPLKSLFLALHVGCLSAVTGRREVCTGLITNTRLDAEDADRVLGLFINVLPLHLEVGNLAWDQLATQVFEVETAMYAHRRYPMAAIQRLAPSKNLFDTVFGFQQYHLLERLTPSTGFEIAQIALLERTNFPLHVSASRNPSGTEGRLLFKHQAPFPPETARELAATMRDAIAALCRGEFHRSCRPRVAGTPRAMVSAHAFEPVHRQIARIAATRAHARALVDTRQTLTFGELERQSNQLARVLRSRGIGEGDLVATILERGTELTLLQLAILKAGGAFLPLSPSDPPSRIRRILGDATPTLVVSRGRMQLDGSWASIGDLLRSGQRMRGSPVEGGGGAENPAYVFFTSGSSGAPKGVVVPRGAFANVIMTMADLIRIRPEDVMLSLTTPSFDISLVETFTPLIRGAQVRFASEDEQSDPRQLAEVVEAAEVSVIQATPWQWRLLLESGWRGHRGLRILCGGDLLTLPLAEALRECGDVVWNLYGPTEATIWCSAGEVPRGAVTVDVGLPLPGMSMEVEAANGRKAHPGETGELLVRGPGLALGYLNRPRLTACRFTRGQAGGAAGRTFRTGDAARQRENGRFEILGRLDEQTKILGVRVEPAEVTAVLESHPDVREATVLAVAHASGERKLVAYVAPRRPNGLTVQSLASFLAEHLPRQFLPADYLVVGALPRLANGKLDRQALMRIADARQHSYELSREGPCDELERRLYELWEETLGRRGIGVNDNFREAGGDSIAALRLALRIERCLGVWVPLSKFVTGGSIASVANYLRRAATEPAICVVPMAGSGSTVPPLFLAHPLGGHVFTYQDLADSLKPFCPVSCFKAFGLDPGEQPLDDIQEMARRYVAAMRSIQPVGPYAIAGWCMGGVIAYEIAAQLHSVGETVAFLGILSSAVSPRLEFGFELRRHILAQHAKVDAEAFAGLSDEEQILRLMDLAAASGGLRPDVSNLASAQRLIGIYEAHAAALRRYQPVPFGGSAIYFAPASARRIDENVDGWNALLAGGVRVERTPGTDDDFMQGSNAAGLAARIVVNLGPRANGDRVRPLGVGAHA
jgi:amino acid adenylation domain-containing protein